MDFGKWDREIHFYPQQVKRIMSAMKISSRNITYSNDKFTCFIQGREFVPYTVTLDSCTCFDFDTRKLPCKHIYCFAYHLGLLNDLPNNSYSYGFDVFEEGERYKELYKNGIISAEMYIKLSEAIGYNNLLEVQLTEKNTNELKPSNKQTKEKISLLGCCSRYMECSKAGHCICPIKNTANRCMYRKNLEKGLNFYYNDESRS